MEATINTLFSGYRNIISYNNSETERPTTFAQLKKCENVLLGDVIAKGIRQAIIDDNIYTLELVTIRPKHGFAFQAIEVL